MRNLLARIAAGGAALIAGACAFLHQSQGYPEIAAVLQAVLFVDDAAHMGQIEAVWLSVSWILLLLALVMVAAVLAPVGMRPASAVTALVFAGMGGAFAAISASRYGELGALPQPMLLFPVALLAALAALLPAGDQPPLELSPG